ncbi:MAG: hypothetical protein ISR24_05475, partial [Candidatus Poseidonia sp.]|nr:hypothetical protein [Poseidonia sp.]
METTPIISSLMQKGEQLFPGSLIAIVTSCGLATVLKKYDGGWKAKRTVTSALWAGASNQRWMQLGLLRKVNFTKKDMSVSERLYVQERLTW